jgi:hypothetical protein
MLAETNVTPPIVSRWINEIVSLEEHIDSMLRRQAKVPTAPSVIRNLYETVHENRIRAETFRHRFREPADSPEQQGLTLLATSPVLTERIGNDNMSHVLRNDFVVCNLAAVMYSMLHTAAIAMESETVAEFAARGLRTYAGTIANIARALPGAVVGELVESRTNSTIDANAAAIAASQQQELWASLPGNACQC